jgi:hypothetical protein
MKYNEQRERERSTHIVEAFFEEGLFREGRGGRLGSHSLEVCWLCNGMNYDVIFQ